MKIKYLFLFIVLILLFFACNNDSEEKHLFILSGQSNMALLEPKESFIPYLEKTLGKKKVIVVKQAWGARPIMRWYKKWKLSEFTSPTGADLYDSLVNKIDLAIYNETLASVSFFWMQGERDARLSYSAAYGESLMGLHNQLKEKFDREDVNFIIGRINDFGFGKEERYPEWQLVREIQENFAMSNPNVEWINTDDLNDGYSRNGKVIENDLHMSAEGYKILGERFAKKGVELINNQDKQK